MRPPVPKHEQKRLKVLWEYEILDTVPGEIFDDMTDLAARICHAPIALISLVDEKRQWFMSRIGFDAKQTPRHIAFCAHAILNDDLFIVEDATKDPRFANNPLVKKSPKIRFYAGAPLVTPDGYVLGTLCVMDHVPRKLDYDQQRALQILARLVMTQLELRRHSKELARLRAHREKNSAALQKLRAQLREARRELAACKAKLRQCCRASGKT
ncbi:MAG: GAF domain-containing protein [Verrucomicrobiae bacterium]|nr:GAF domain-containing protein [Verrucomicrobiae bacterium]MDW7980272.1 GAF domain-containing protein [Verrucomicrobiales bacterium]